MKRIAVAVASIGIAAMALSAQMVERARTVGVPESNDSTHRAAALPFAPGERLEYAISFGPIHVGSGSMELALGDTVRAEPTYHATLKLSGGTLFFRVDDRIESWFDTTRFTSLRFIERIREGRYHADRNYEIFPDRSIFIPAGDTARASVPRPLDDASFLYFLRTLRLDIGAQYEFRRYFQLEGNPIILRVLRREPVSVPAGRFDAIVVQPLITTGGIFSKRGRAEVWIRADGGHEVLQMKSHLAFGSLNLYLTRIQSGSR